MIFTKTLRDRFVRLFHSEAYGNKISLHRTDRYMTSSPTDILSAH